MAVLDHGLFSFADVKHRTWPVILITNPKPAETVQPSKEPTGLMGKSSHIRLLLYSPSAIQLCEVTLLVDVLIRRIFLNMRGPLQVRIDDGDWIECRLTGKSHPLYTAPWQPQLYSSGLHILEVRAKDASGSETSAKIEFSLDGSRSPFPILARLILMIDMTTFVSYTNNSSLPFVRLYNFYFYFCVN